MNQFGLLSEEMSLPSLEVFEERLSDHLSVMLLRRFLE